MDSSDEEQESFWKKQPETLSQADFEKRKRKFKKNKKYRKELIREEKMNATKMETNIIEMRTGEQDIVITDHFPLSYNPGNVDFDKTMIGDITVWHQVFVHHNRSYNREQILASLFKFIPENEFYPVAYRESKVSDYFFLRACHKALVQLLEHNCKLPMEDNQCMDVTIKLGVAKYQQGQINQNEKVSAILREKAMKAGEEGVMNLDQFPNHPTLVDVALNLSNTASFRMVCSKINSIDAVRTKIRKISLVNNEIRNLEPFADFNRIKLKVLDLRNNHIVDFQRIKHLRPLDLEELHLEGNPITKLPRFHEIIKEHLPTLRKVDGFEYAPPPRVQIERELGSGDRPIVRSSANKNRWKNGNEKLAFIGDGDLIRSNDINSLSVDKLKQYNRKDVWHQVVLYHGGKHDKEVLLKGLLEIVGDSSFYPCYYKKYAKQDEFFLYNCFDALEKLVRNAKLILKINNDIVNVVLKMNVSEFKEDQINYYEKINYVLVGRYYEGVLDLSNFSNDVEFSQIYVSLNTSMGIMNVLKWAAKQFPGVTKIDFQKNNIKRCVGFGNFSILPKLRALDLRWNKIESFDDFSGMTVVNKITELNIDGNPICKAYGNKPKDFIVDIKKIFQDVELIDGLKVKGEIPFLTKQNYLCSPTAYTMVENFIQHYFMLYDSAQRASLREMYSEDSLVSLSCYFTFERNQQNIVPRAKVYGNTSRNILKMSDYVNQSSTSLIVGADKIGHFLNYLPQTEHDLLTFTVDVPMNERDMTLIIVSGVFKEKASTLLDTDLTFGFSRSFLLKPYQKGEGVFGKSYEYKIYNDLIYLHTATIAQRESSFKNTMTYEDLEIRHRDLMPTDFETKQVKLLLFKELTELKQDYCVKFLGDTDWNIKMALMTFRSCMERGMLGNEAFE